MSYSDVRNGIIVGRSELKPTKIEKGIWMLDIMVGEEHDISTEDLEGPVVTIQEDTVTYTYTAVPSPNAVEQLKEHVRDKIFAEQLVREDAGTEMPSGLKVETTDAALAKILGALDESRGNPNAKRKFNGKHGRGNLSLNDMEDLITAIRSHKQGVHDWAYDLAIQLDDSNVDSVAKVRVIEALVDADINS